MCGICGIVLPHGKPRTQTVETMLEHLRHRGPDGENIVVADHAVFGHARLSVIDLSDASAQPMQDWTGRYLMTFNGELYNYRELRRELSSMGYKIATQGDAEILLTAYIHWGENFLAKLNGMFAFAIWDKVERSLFLARDRIGEKPLFYAIDAHGSFLFASEPAALTAVLGKEQINPMAFAQFLLCNYTTGSDTLFERVKRLAPGHFLQVTSQGVAKPQCYWYLPDYFQCKTPLSFAQAAEQLRELLDDSVAMRTVSDVPVGCMLSGGLDSSSVLASLNATGHDEIDCFSIGFTQKSFSELGHAHDVAAYFNRQLHAQITPPEPQDFFTILDWFSREPLCDTSCFPTYQLCQFARQKVTVSLGGDGADELFAGYPTYLADQLSGPLRKLPSPLIKILYRFADNFLPNSFEKVSFDYKLRKFLRNASLDKFRAHAAWRSILDLDELAKVVTPNLLAQIDLDGIFDDFIPTRTEIKGLSLLDQGLLIDCKTWLPDDILVKCDRASMAHGLELRSPFLDHRIIEFAAALPSTYKLKNYRRKRVLKAAQVSRLPNKTRKRKKTGFNAPLSFWLLSQFGWQLKLLIEQSGLYHWVQPEFVSALFDEHMAGRRDNSLKILSLYSLSRHMG